MIDSGQWLRCRDHILPSLETCQGTYTERDIVDGLIDGHYQLFEGNKCAVITSILTYPQAKAVHFFLVGGDLDELTALEPEILEWARGQGCTRAEFSGRRGWLRALDGYQELCTIGYKEIPKHG